MSAQRGDGRRRLCFCYACPEGFSGQKEAAQLVLRGLADRGWHCTELHQPVLDRRRNDLFRYFGAMVAAWWRALRLLPRSRGHLWVAMGQTRASFVRDAVPLLIGRLVLGRGRLIVSLNGSLFMHWSACSFDARAFRWIVANAGTVAVVGERQRRHLVALGVSERQATVVVNTCALRPLTAEQLENKLARVEGPVRCLFLSSLIATKGFPEYLEALHQLSRRPGPKVEAVLCGTLVESEFSQRFPNREEAERWINSHLAAINRSDRVTARWITGARGEAKTELLVSADIFVLPTYYAVEAQPLALLEAMAAGCAIVTTAVAEIPTILDESSARFVAVQSSTALSQALRALVGESKGRTALARAAHARFVKHYRVERHLDAWEEVLRGAEKGDPS